MEALLESRYELGWMMGTAADWIFVVNNRIVDAATRYPKKFKFNRIVGVIDEYDYVCWGGMGMNFADIGNPLMRFAINNQTNYGGAR